MRMITSEVVVDLIKRRFKPIDFNWESDATDIIGEAIDFIDINMSYELTWKTLTVENNRVRVPQEAQSIELVMYQGELLNKSIKRTGLNPTDTTVSAGINAQAIDQLETLTRQYEALEIAISNSTDMDEITRLQEKQAAVLAEMLEVNKTIVDKPVTIPDGEEYWMEQGHWITTSFSTGDILVYYRKYFLDQNDYPMIIDNHLYRQAVYYYFAAEMLEMGYEHKNYTFADVLQLKDEYKDRATNSVLAPTQEDMEAFCKIWVRMKPNYNLGKSNFVGV